MASLWRRRLIERQLAGLRSPGERLTTVGRLELGGWWAMSDRALYTLGRFDEPKRVALHDIRSVHVASQRATVLVTVTTATGSVVAGDFHQGSELVGRLQDLRTPPGPAPS